MTNSFKDLSKYKKMIDAINCENQEVYTRKVELFFSFDVVNSTLYKNINYSSWGPILTQLFKKIQYRVSEQLESSQIWRVIGDEIVFIIQIKHLDSISEYIDKIFGILTYFNKELQKVDFYDFLNVNSQVDILNLKGGNIISLQSAAWIAIINSNINSLKEFDSVWETYEITPGYLLNEFLGNDIDAGFRIKKETMTKRLAISFELAYFLSEKTQQLSNLNIVSYKKLKGIWKNKLYPIIWYHNSNIYDNISFEESFCYDEIQDNVADIFLFNGKEYLLKDGCYINDKMYKDVNYAINKILYDNNLEQKVQEIKNVILDSKGDHRNFLDESSVQELHCVALCFDFDEKKLLILKRDNNRQKMPGKWEFGCVKSNFNKNLKNNIIDGYKDLLNIDISLFLDKNRDDQQPIPIAIYEIDNGQNHIDKGIIVIAKIINKENINLQHDKYETYQFISKDEVCKYENNSVNDFKDTVNKGFRIIEKARWEIDN